VSEDGFDLNSLVEQAQAMQQQMTEAQEAHAQQILVGTAGGGKVTIEASGLGEFRSVSIAPDAVDADDVELLEELILAALHDVTAKLNEVQASAMERIQLPDLGGLGGMLGGS
jgi:DNA-binding YbaB/EbfC family protein